MRERIQKTRRLFLPMAFALILAVGVSCVNGQLLLRQGANEPQIGLAHDLANQLADLPTSTTPLSGRIAIESSLSPYVVIYDSYGTPVSGTGYLHDALPTLPPGIFDVARSKGGDIITWQPEPGIREAIVVEPIGTGASGFVMSGRSLAYVEQEERQLLLRSIAGLLIALLIAFAVSFFIASRTRTV